MKLRGGNLKKRTHDLVDGGTLSTAGADLDLDGWRNGEGNPRRSFSGRGGNNVGQPWMASV